ncbi:MAG: tetratricopeptide repeat protein [Pseudomonadota bacterium]
MIVTDKLKAGLVLAMLMLYGCATTPTEVPSDADSATEEAPVPIPEAVISTQQQVIALLRNDGAQDVIEVLPPVIEAYPDYPGLQLNLGIAHFELGQFDRAQSVFSNIVSDGQASPVAHNYLGILHRQGGRFAEARKSYERAISEDGTYSLAYLNLGILCDIYLQDLDCALQHYERYESLQTEVDKQFKGWKIDLQRRIKARNSAQ